MFNKHPRDMVGRYTRTESISKKVRRIYWYYMSGVLITVFAIVAYGGLLFLTGQIGHVEAQNAPQGQIEAQESFVELNQYGVMGDEIILASKEFDVPVKLILGIANAESSLGTNFVHPYDFNCNNWWGIRKVRDDGSYLRCFVDEESGARTVAKILRLYYLDEGRTTPEKIAPKWLGTNDQGRIDIWVKNVNNYDI